MVNGELSDDPLTFTTQFNNVFVSVASQNQNNYELQTLNRNPILSVSMMLSPVCEAGAPRVIQDVPPKTSEDINGVSMWVGKRMLQQHHLSFDNNHKSIGLFIGVKEGKSSRY